MELWIKQWQIHAITQSIVRKSSSPGRKPEGDFISQRNDLQGDSKLEDAVSHRQLRAPGIACNNVVIPKSKSETTIRMLSVVNVLNYIRLPQQKALKLPFVHTVLRSASFKGGKGPRDFW